MAQEILAIATTDGYFLSCNPAMTETLGWTESELQVTPFASFAHPDQLEELGGIVAQLAAGKTIARYEVRSRHRDGSWRWLSWTIVPQGRLLYMAGRHVTEEKQRQDALRQAQKMGQVLAEVLRGAGHTVFEAGDAATALAKLRHIDRVDLLVTDVGLPGGVNGRQLADAIRAGQSAIRVLLITGYT